MKLNCVVVDDSSIQRMIITKLVNNHPNLHLIGDFSNAIEAKGCMTIHNVDLIFLDIEMPVISGFDFLDGLKTKPQIIFITSKAEYAMKAFDYDATDYLQKPIAVDRFNASVKNINGFMKRGYTLDKKILNHFNYQDWMNITNEVITRLPDSVLHAALLKLPDAVQNNNGDIFKKMTSRRNSLAQLSKAYYKRMH